MFNPLISLTELSDKDLQEKINEMNERLVTANYMGMGSSVTDTIKAVIASCHEELYSRAAMKEHERTKDVHVVFDQEEYLKKKDEKHESTGKQNYRPGW